MESAGLKDFFSFIYERQLIWHKRFFLKRDFPWTDDEILRKYKIINVYRELDKCTIYLLEKLKGMNDRAALLLNIVFYRFFNRVGLYEELEIQPFAKLDDGLFEKIKKGFADRTAEGKVVFNNAYIISSRGGEERKYIEVLKGMRSVDFAKLVEQIDIAKTPEEAFLILQQIPLVGPFLACEIWTDLSYFDFFKQGWDDNDFVNIGPGAKWGLEILFGKLNKKQLHEKLKELYQLQESHLSEVAEKPSWREIAYKNAFSNYPFLSITNVEGALCEFRKYWNIKHGKGRRKYFKR